MSTRTPTPQTTAPAGDPGNAQRVQVLRDWGTYAWDGSGALAAPPAGYTGRVYAPGSGYLPNAPLNSFAGDPGRLAQLQAGDWAWTEVAAPAPGDGPKFAKWVCIYPGTALGGDALWAFDNAPSVVGLLRSYGDSTLAYRGNTPYPLSTGSVGQTTVQGGGSIFLWNEFDTFYSRCRVRIRRVSAGDVVTLDVTGTFTDQNAVVAFLNANTTDDGSGNCEDGFIWQVFDEIDPGIVPITKIYGQNRLFMSLRGQTNPKNGRKARYWGRISTAEDAANTTKPAALAARQSVLSAIWLGLFGPPLDASFVAPAAMGPAEFRCFWFGGNRLHRYDAPKFTPSAVYLPVDGSLHNCVDPTGAVISTGTSVYQYNPGANDRCFYASFDSSGNFAQSFGSSSAWKLLGRAILNGETVVVGLPLIDNNSGNVSVLLKPVGVDNLFFGPFDDTQFRLEAVGYTINDMRARIVVPSIPGQFPSRRTTTPLLLADFRAAFGGSGPQVRQGGGPGRHGWTTGRLRFQLRDLATGRVSPLSDAEAITRTFRRAMPWSVIVRNHHGA